MKIETICFVPARIGSKSIRYKNLQKISGKELIKYTFNICKYFKNKFISIISSDSEKILKIGKSFSLYSNGLRPKKLSTDHVLTYDVIKYELYKIEKKLNYPFKNIMILQPTCPFRKIRTINKALRIISSKKYDSVTTICGVRGYHPERMKVLKKKKIYNYTKKITENLKPRQSLPKVYIRSGSIYLIKRDAFFKYKSLIGKNCFGIIVREKEAINIDDKTDLIIARNIS
jgi:CMP-N-acetylneuraminic acid synthetase